MNIIFAGTPEFAVPALTALIEAGHTIAMVLTQPDRPAGRGMLLKASPIKQLAARHDLPVFQPTSLKPADVQAQIAAIQAEVMIVAAYGLIIPASVLQMPKFGCYNIHASILPRWRGAAPIHRALLAGDRETGVTIMEVVPALDAGAMVSKGVVPIHEDDTTQSLHDKLAAIGADLMVQAMQELSNNGVLSSEAQDKSLVTYAHKLEKAESAIDWRKSAAEISRQVRGFNPFPVATAQFKGETCRIWFAKAIPPLQPADVNVVKPGQIVGLEAGIQIACGDAVLCVTELQMPGAKRQTAQQFAQGQHIRIGEFFS